MPKKILILCSVCILLQVNDLISQRFQFAGIAGVNAAQIDGDSLFGYKKSGLHIGGRISYFNQNSFDIALEMLYSQRGAAKSFTENSPKDIIKADYIEIPLVFCLRDWYNDAHKYYKVRAEFGVSYAQLVRIESSKYDVENFNRRDISWFLGSGLRFSPHMGIALRYTSSFLNMYTNPSDKTVRFKSYFLTFRAEYFF
ncbi:MAG: porin family protein [Saprospiraceae bacterium]|jgi:hypothetical protein|nr:PorT family protein [Saprospiraceae bacterium]